MRNLLTKLTVTPVTTTALSGAIALSVGHPAPAITFNYSFQTDTNYTGKGQFKYDELTAPAMISESGAGPTNFLQFLSLSVFSPAGNLLDSGNSVVDSISNDSFLLFEFDTGTETLSVFDNNTEASGSDPYYFISNAVDPDYIFVGPGNTDFNLFAFSPQTPDTADFLGSTSSIQVSRVPEPTSVLSLLALGGLGAGSIRKKKRAGSNPSIT